MDAQELLDSWRSFSAFVVAPGEEMQEAVVKALALMAQLGVSAPVLVAPGGDPFLFGRGSPMWEELLRGAALDLRYSLRPNDPARSIREAVRASVIQAFGRVLFEVLPPPKTPILNRAVRVLLDQVPPSVVEVSEDRVRVDGRILREVDGLAERMGCSSGYLRSAAREWGGALGALVRWTAVLHGLSVFDEARTSWTEVGIRLGFRTPAAFTHFVRRTTGRCPSELVREPWHLILARALDAVVRK